LSGNFQRSRDLFEILRKKSKLPEKLLTDGRKNQEKKNDQWMVEEIQKLEKLSTRMFYFR
jgi:hypothetical protein